MPYQIEKLGNGSSGLNRTIDARELQRRVEHLIDVQAPRYRRLWAYYRNPMLPAPAMSDPNTSARPYRHAQEWGLPARITGFSSTTEIASGDPIDGVARKEIVVENDIGWRVETMVDFLFSSNVGIRSTAPDAARRAQIESLLRAIFANHGGITFFQQLALLGAVYGFVDVLVKLDRDALEEPIATDSAPEDDLQSEPSESLEASNPAGPGLAVGAGETGDARSLPSRAGSAPADDASLRRVAQAIRLEIVEAARALPLLNPLDWRDVLAYVQCYTITPSRELEHSTSRSNSTRWVDRLIGRLASVRRNLSLDAADDNTTSVVEVITDDHWQRYEGERLVAEGRNSLGALPLVHIQNTAVPFEYSGASDVEPLIPLQDELNTRLCDRANRITMQSFKMYLGKGIENFTSLPVSPGRMWMTDNESAEITEFGGDSSCPSEDRHVAELREAMDKISGVTPIAAGIIRNRIGHLTSAAALRVTMLALLARTRRKQITYGGGIARVCELALMWLDRAGLFHTTPDERRIELDWPAPMPLSDIP